MSKNEVYTFTIDEWNRALKRADEIMKKTNGHEYIQILKTRCQLCGRSPRQKGVCAHWQISLINRLLFVLMNKETELAPTHK